MFVNFSARKFARDSGSSSDSSVSEMRPKSSQHQPSTDSVESAMAFDEMSSKPPSKHARQTSDHTQPAKRPNTTNDKQIHGQPPGTESVSSNGPEAYEHTFTASKRSNSKSKYGCLTCKFRKKKCDETKPVCRDCRRFKKECVWVDHRTMNGEEIELLKRRVRDEESSRKMRKRTSLHKPDLSSHFSNHMSPSPLPEMVPDSDGMIPSFPHGNVPVSSSAFLSHPISELRESPVSPNHAIPIQTDLVKDESQDHIVSQPLQPAQNERSLLTEFSEIATRDLPELVRDSQSAQSDSIALQPLDSHSPWGALSEPRSPSAVLNFLKELSVFNWNSSDSQTGQIEDLTDPQSIVNGELVKPSSPDSTGRGSPSFNIPHFMEQVQTMAHDFPMDFDYQNLASSFNATFSPSPRASVSFSPELDQSGFHLYTYYSEVLSRKMSIAPNSQNESNSYQRVFLPLAQKDKGVLYGILAWAGFHLGGQWLAEGIKYAELAFKHLCEDFSFNEGSQSIRDRRVIINKLATILIMCGAEICRGDVKVWSMYLQWGWKLLRDNGGILNFNKNKEEHWLISNFAYHDLLASSTSDRGTYFPNQTYDRIFIDPDGISRGNMNPLLGVSKPLYKVIGDISSLFFESKQIMNDYYRRRPSASKNADLASPEEGSISGSFSDTMTDVSDHSRVASLLNFINDKAHELELVITNSKPDAHDLESLSDSELEWQLTAFEAFQLSCKLYLRQAILKLNPSALECQILKNDLTKCLDVLLGSPLQATTVFPLFIAGIFSVTDGAKASMRLRLDTLISDYGPWNVVRVKSLLEKIWSDNPQGDRVVDWNMTLNEMGWDLNFA